MCSGQRNTGPASDCTHSDGQLLEQVRQSCQGEMSCSVPVGGHLANLRNLVILKPSKFLFSESSSDNLLDNNWLLVDSYLYLVLDVTLM